MKIFRIPKISRKSIIVLSEFRYAALGDISPPLENIPPPQSQFLLGSGWKAKYDCTDWK